MAKPSRDVTDAELDVLEVLWDAGPSTIRTIAARLHPRGGTSEYATIQKLLERLERKRCVARDRSAFAHVFAAAVAREDLIGRRLRDVAAKLCDGSLTPLLMQLVGDARLSVSDREALRRLIDGPEPQAQTRRK
jgi:BlaI family penicillinase repressor